MATINFNEIPEVLQTTSQSPTVLEYLIQQLPKELQELARDFAEQCGTPPGKTVASPQIFTRGKRMLTGNLYAALKKANITLTLPE